MDEKKVVEMAGSMVERMVVWTVEMKAATASQTQVGQGIYVRPL